MTSYGYTRLADNALRRVSFGPDDIALFRELARALKECDRERLASLGAMHFLCHTHDSEPWIKIYREAGGGYEGLQAVARAVIEGDSA